MSYLGRPLVPPSTLLSAAANINRPVTPSRELSGDENGGESSRAWSPKKREDAARQLNSLVEELVRTERSYLMRIRALKSVSPLKVRSRAPKADLVVICRSPTLFREGQAYSDHTTVRGQEPICKYRSSRALFYGISGGSGGDVGERKRSRSCRGRLSEARQLGRFPDRK